MLRVRLTVAVVAALCLAGCSLIPGMGGSNNDAGQPSVTVPDDGGATDAGQPSDDSATSADSDDSGASDETFDTSGIAARGFDSKECAAAEKVIATIVQIPGAAPTGDVTQEMIDTIFAADALKDIPDDAASVLGDLKSASAALIGVNAGSDSGQMDAWTTAYSNWVQVAAKICT